MSEEAQTSTLPADVTNVDLTGLQEDDLLASDNDDLERPSPFKTPTESYTPYNSPTLPRSPSSPNLNDTETFRRMPFADRSNEAIPPVFRSNNESNGRSRSVPSSPNPRIDNSMVSPVIINNKSTSRPTVNNLDDSDSTEVTGDEAEQNKKKNHQQEEAERVRRQKEKERTAREKKRKEVEEEERRNREEEPVNNLRRERIENATIQSKKDEIARLERMRKQLEKDVRSLKEKEPPRRPVNNRDLTSCSQQGSTNSFDQNLLTQLIFSIQQLAESSGSRNAESTSSVPSSRSDEDGGLSTAQKRIMALDRAYEVPSRSLPEYSEAERLHGSRNYREWLKRITSEFGALNLTPFTKADKALGLVELSDNKRNMLDQMALTHLRSTVDKNVKHVIIDATTCYEAMCSVHKLYQHNRIHDKVLLESRFNMLRFKDGFNRERFTKDFETLIAQLEKNGEVFTPESKAVKFLEKIDGIYHRTSPFWNFYSDITAKNPEKITYEYVKERFFRTRLAKEDTGKRKADDRSDDNERKKRKTDDKSKSSDNSSQSKKQYLGNQKENVDKTRKPDQKSNVPKDKDKFKATPLREKYTKEQLDSLKTMSREEKEKVRCKKCWEYFHTEETCKNPGPICFICKRYDHRMVDCKFYDPKIHKIRAVK